jgi:hypothetical protein
MINPIAFFFLDAQPLRIVVLRNVDGLPHLDCTKNFFAVYCLPAFAHEEIIFVFRNYYSTDNSLFQRAFAISNTGEPY